MQIYIENVLVDPRTGGFELLWKNLIQSVALIGRNTFCIKHVDNNKAAMPNYTPYMIDV